MNFLTRVADTATSCVIGTPYMVAKSLWNLPPKEAVKKIVNNTILVPAVHAATMSIPLLGKAAKIPGKVIGTGAQKITDLLVSRSIRNAVHQTLQKLPTPPSARAEKLLANGLTEALQSFVTPHAAKRAIKTFTTNVIAGTICASASNRVLSQIYGTPVPSLKTTAIDSLFETAVFTGVKQLMAMMEDEPSEPNTATKEELKQRLTDELNALAAKNPSMIPKNLKGALPKVLEAVAEAIVESPLTDLSQLDLVLYVKSYLRRSFLMKIFQHIVLFLKSLAYGPQKPHQLIQYIEQLNKAAKTTSPV